MTPSDISGALQVFASHQLYEAKYSISTYLEIDSNAFFVAIDSINGEVIGCCGAPFTRPDSAFLGLYAVRKEYFGRGIGQILFKNVMKHIGDRNCGLFSVPNKIHLYRNILGFGVEANTYLGVCFGKGIRDCSENTVNFKPIFVPKVIENVIKYDESIHYFRRERLLKLSFKERNCLSFAAEDKKSGTVVGYGCIREDSSGGATLNPIYANNKEIAKQLIVKLINSFEIGIKNGYFYYTIDSNKSALDLAKELNFRIDEFDPLLYRNNVTKVDYNKIYSVFCPDFSL